MDAFLGGGISTLESFDNLGKLLLSLGCSYADVDQSAQVGYQDHKRTFS